MDKIASLKESMIAYFTGDPKRIHHFLKVHSLAKLIGETENLDDQTLFILESTALVHDIGIKPAEEKFDSCTGKLQEQEGPAPARKLLASLNYKDEDIERICYLISRHHTYSDMDGADCQILVEADFLVNLYEDGTSKDGILKAYNTIFKTACGRSILKQMYGI